jgi:hypothetical protein
VIHRRPDKDYELWIINHSRREVFFTLYQKVHGKFKGLNAAGLAPGERRMAAHLSTHEFHMVQQVTIQLMQFPIGDKARPMPMLTLEIDCKSEVLNRDLEELADVGLAGWEFILEQKALAFHEESAPKPLYQVPSDGPEVVDLHIERFESNLMGMSSAMMLQRQLEEFEKAITDAQLRKAKTMVFIHGSGSGKLRKEIHERLRMFKFVRNFEQADPLRYGNGATLVQFA